MHRFQCVVSQVFLQIDSLKAHVMGCSPSTNLTSKGFFLFLLNGDTMKVEGPLGAC